MTPESSRHVLVVDDDPDLCPVIRRTLLSDGYLITCAKDGFEALRLFAEMGNEFSLILSDINMPGMTGCELVLGLKARGLKSPVLFMSGDCRQATEARCQSIGKKVCLPKPFTPDELRQAVDAAVSSLNFEGKPETGTLMLRVYPDPILRAQCATISTYDSDLQTLSEQMFIFMRENRGVGLAGPQVGITERIIVADDGETALCLVNPEIVSSSDTEHMVEGCLSLPGVQVDVARKARVEVIGKRQDGKSVSIVADGLLARILQHEIDHLNGTLICDYDPDRKMYP
ncbi:MAG: peptide deformylase [Methylothermaceae bacterium]|nr:peptide deformylase [Methylothermaceae bacterium]